MCVKFLRSVCVCFCLPLSPGCKHFAHFCLLTGVKLTQQCFWAHTTREEYFYQLHNDTFSHEWNNQTYMIKVRFEFAWTKWTYAYHIKCPCLWRARWRVLGGAVHLIYYVNTITSLHSSSFYSSVLYCCSTWQHAQNCTLSNVGFKTESTPRPRAYRVRIENDRGQDQEENNNTLTRVKPDAPDVCFSFCTQKHTGQVQHSSNKHYSVILFDIIAEVKEHAWGNWHDQDQSRVSRYYSVVHYRSFTPFLHLAID